jgi:hypothetical protein
MEPEGWIREYQTGPGYKIFGFGSEGVIGTVDRSNPACMPSRVEKFDIAAHATEMQGTMCRAIFVTWPQGMRGLMSLRL